MARIDRLLLRVRFVEDPGSDPLEEWNLDSDGVEVDVPEGEFDEALEQLFKSAGAHSAYLHQRTLRSGGWGATGLSVMEILITVGTGVATSAVYESLKALFQKFADRAPSSRRTKPAPRTKKKAVRKTPRKSARKRS